MYYTKILPGNQQCSADLFTLYIAVAGLLPLYHKHWRNCKVFSICGRRFSDWWFLNCGSEIQPSSFPLYRVYSKGLSASSSHCVTFFSSTLSFPTSLWIIELFLSRRPVPLIRCVDHQACFTAPSPTAAATPMLPHDIEEITHMSLTYFLVTPPLAPSQSFLKLPTS